MRPWWWWPGRELGRWQAAGRRPLLWWRDDDARDATPALARLIGLAEAHGLPLLLAVVPGEGRRDGPDEGLRRLEVMLEGRRGIFIAQHGVTHVNGRPSGGPAGEFAEAATAGEIAAAIGRAGARLDGLPGRLPLFVPPWNAVHPGLPSVLPGLGFRGLSAAGEVAAPGLRQFHAELDLLRWKPGPRFRGAGRCLLRLDRLLRARRLAGDWGRPIGLLTHHLDHDERAWSFLGGLLARLAADPRVDWASPASMLDEDGAGRLAQ